jgi:hypothetical protein
MDNTNDKARENAAKPACGYSEERHKGKDNRSDSGHAGVTPHPEKKDGKNRQEPLSTPNSGYVYHSEKEDGKNRKEPVSTPQTGYASGKAKVKFDDSHKEGKARTPLIKA